MSKIVDNSPKIFNPGDRIIVIDDSRAVHWFKNGLIGTVSKQMGDRVYVTFDKYPEMAGMNGNVRRFKHLSPLDNLL